ncbi:MAG: hypothetical protein ACYDGN_08775 [Acidimicrobiales bacterium]
MPHLVLIVLGVLTVASLVAVCSYVLLFFAVGAWAWFARSRSDPLADEVGQLFDELSAFGIGGRPDDTPSSTRGALRRAPRFGSRVLVKGRRS